MPVKVDGSAGQRKPRGAALRVTSTIGISEPYFNENSGGDDIFVRDFVFGLVDW